MRNIKTNEKAAWQGGSVNRINDAGGIDNDLFVNNATKTLKNQRFCSCGSIIPRDEVLLEKARTCSTCRQKETELKSEILAIVTTPRRIVKCIPCKSCKKPFGINKLSSLLICRTCTITTQTEPPAKQNRIFAEIIKNYTIALRQQIFAGGAAR